MTSSFNVANLPICSIMAANTTFSVSQSVCATGKVLWQSQISTDKTVKSFLSGSNEMLYLQTDDKILALSQKNGALLWQSQGQNRGQIALTVEQNLVFLQKNGKELVLLEGKTGSEIKKIPISAHPMALPIPTSFNHILVNEIENNSLTISAYDRSLQKSWQIPLGDIHSCPTLLTFDDAFVSVLDDTISCYNPSANKLWSLPFSSLGSASPTHIAKLLPNFLLLSFTDNSSVCSVCVFNIKTQQVTPFQLPEKIAGYPMIINKAQGDFDLVYQAPKKNLGFGSYEYRVVMVTSRGEKKWEITDSLPPRFMISDEKETAIIAFSLDLDSYRLSSAFRTDPPGYVRAFNEMGTELYKHTAPCPILSPLCAGNSGEVYFFADGTVQAIV